MARREHARVYRGDSVTTLAYVPLRAGPRREIFSEVQKIAEIEATAA
jgi:hypothetical protein